MVAPMRARLWTCLILTACLVGCDDGPSPTDAGPDAALLDDGGDRDAGAADAGTGDAGDRDAGTDAGPAACPRSPAAADRTRYVVVAHPFGTPSYEVLELATDGTLSTTSRRFAMGQASSGEIVFTPDGEVGLIAQADGTIGVFSLDVSGVPTVLHTGYDGGFYAGAVVMDPAGDGAWVLDSEWRESGGGVYRIEIGCDGRIAGEQLVAASRLPYGMGLLADGRAVLAAKDVLDTTLGPDVHVISLDTPSVLSSADLFVEDDWIGGSFSVAFGEGHAFLGDNSAFSATGNRLGVVSIVGDIVTAVQEIAGVEDPVAILSSPFDDRVLVVSGFGDAIFVYAYDAASATPLTSLGELAYDTRRPALPGSAAMIRRGSLEGLVLVSENVAVRRVRFASGAVTDLGPFELGSGTDAIAGAIGVQP